MNENPQVKRDADELQDALLRQVERGDVDGIAAAAYVQANFAQQCAQAVLILLQHKGIISEAEVQKALGDAYHARTHQLRNNGRVIMPAPFLKPNGSH